MSLISTNVANGYADSLRERIGKSWWRRVRLSENEAYAIIDLLRCLVKDNEQARNDADRFEKQSEAKAAEIQSLTAERDALREQVKRLQDFAAVARRELRSLDCFCTNCWEPCDKSGFCPNDCPPF